MELIYEKFNGDAAIYQVCPKCDFKHMVGSAIDLDDGLSSGYNYCPMCGVYLHTDKAETDIVWNERNCELMDMVMNDGD